MQQINAIEETNLLVLSLSAAELLDEIQRSNFSHRVPKLRTSTMLLDKHII